jgi:hypothetical protein
VVLDTRNNTAKEFRSMTMEEIDTRLAYEYWIWNFVRRWPRNLSTANTMPKQVRFPHAIVSDPHTIFMEGHAMASDPQTKSPQGCKLLRSSLPAGHAKTTR